jgi:hypothetical protein
MTMDVTGLQPWMSGEKTESGSYLVEVAGCNLNVAMLDLQPAGRSGSSHTLLSNHLPAA